MSKLDKFFKYKIGDIVATRAGVHQMEWAKPMNDRHIPQALQILERLLQECHGGLQLHYVVRAHNLKLYDAGGLCLEGIRLTEPEREGGSHGYRDGGQDERN